LALQGKRLYVGTANRANLHVIDIDNPHDPDFTADRDGNGVPDVVLGSFSFPSQFNPRGVVIQETIAYVMAVPGDPGLVGTLEVIDITDETNFRILSSVDLPVQIPTGLAVANDVMYIGALTAGLLVFDIREPETPRLARAVEDPDPSDAIDVSVIAGPLVAGGFVYLIESRRDQITDDQTEHLVVFDLEDPLTPVRRGALPMRGVSIGRVAADISGGTNLAAAGNFVYVARGTLGLQAIDVSDPDAPLFVGAVFTPGQTVNVTSADTVLYLTDGIFGLQVVQGPGALQADTDGDGIIDFFDRFPTNPQEFLDTDDDRLGDNADSDDDNDGFTDAEEQSANPPTDAFDPLRYPVTTPPAGVTTLIVDASSPAEVRERNGTPEAPYRSLTEALTIISNGQAPQVDTVHLRAGLYAPSTTQDIFPLEIRGQSGLTFRGEDQNIVVLDAELRAETIVVRESADVTIEDITITHGSQGIAVTNSHGITIRRNSIRFNDGAGILFFVNNTRNLVHDNLIESHKAAGLALFGQSDATVTQNDFRSNSEGIAVTAASTADIRGNVIDQNSNRGIIIFAQSSATIVDNVVQHTNGNAISVSTGSQATVSNNLTQTNARDGINIFRESTAIVTDNVSQHNGRFGILVGGLSTAELINNTVTHSGSDGIRFSSSNTNAFIRGGIVSENGGNGIRVGGGSSIPGPSRATVGVDSDLLLEVSQNGRAGVRVDDDGSETTIDSRNIEFDGNAEGDTAGNVIDIAP
jgi:parallel beta-helix repeat protein